jgi:membrane protease subunit HflK
LYLEAIEEVYSGSNKIIIDTEGSGNLLYLPIDKLMERSGSRSGDGESNRSSDSQIPDADASQIGRDTSRDRRTRQ